MTRSLAVLTLAALPMLVAAQGMRTYSCSQGNLVRRVEVARLDSGEVPCEVRYHKEGADMQVLWSASSEAGYCEARAREFVAKLQGLGWVCSDDGSSADASRPGEDDTQVLEPGR